MRWWIGSRVYRRSQAQWAPTLTSHDPDYVLTINDPAVAAVQALAGLQALECGFGKWPGLHAIMFGTVRHQ